MSEPMPPVPNVLKAVVEGLTSFAKNWLSVFHFLYTGSAPNATDLLALATIIYNQYFDQFKDNMPPTTSLESVSLTDLSTDMMPTTVYATHNVGTSTADKLPANCSTLINYDVGMRYRGGHPRNYLYLGVDENLLNESQWNPTYLTTIAAELGNFLGNIIGSASGGTTITEQVMVSYFGGVPTIGGKSQRRLVPLVLPILDFSINPIVGSQRRRLGRRA